MPRPRKSVQQHIANGTYKPSRHGPRPGAPPSNMLTRKSYTGPVTLLVSGQSFQKAQSIRPCCSRNARVMHVRTAEQRSM